MKMQESKITLEFRKISFLLFVLISVSISWAIINSHDRNKGYSIFIEFDNANGIKQGTPLRLRGLTIGSVLDVIHDRNAILAMAKINTNTTIIPKNSLVETSQTGLFSETAIDIIPLYNIEENRYKQNFNPFHSKCIQSNTLCHLSFVEGDRGLNYDDLIRATTRISQRFDDPRFFNLCYLFLQNGLELSDNLLEVSTDFLGFVELFVARLNK